jgi:nucleoside-triphosphatase THEP1
MQAVTIVTGPIDSGKTSWCRQLAAGKQSFAGVLLAKVYMPTEPKERIGYDAVRIPDFQRIPFARVVGREPSAWQTAERIGQFSVSAAALRAVNAWLIRAADETAGIIIDEIGPLELQGKGLSAGLQAVLASPSVQQVYIVVRSGCVEPVCRHFGIDAYDCVDVVEEPNSG